MVHHIQIIETANPTSPGLLKRKEIRSEFPTLWAIGNLAILNGNLLGLFCSVKCPGRIILKTYDTMRVLRDSGISVVSGFHSPIEKDCLDILLKGTQPIVVCPARSMVRMRIPKEWRKAINAGRMLLLSPFDEKKKRQTVSSARIRNQLVTKLCRKIFIPYADAESKTERLCHEIIAADKTIHAFESSRGNCSALSGAILIRSAKSVLKCIV